MSISRRQLLTAGGATGVGLVVAGALPALGEAPPLHDDPDGILALPEGSKCRIVTYGCQTELA